MKTSLKASILSLAVFLLAFQFTGCAYRPTPVDQFYGTSFELAKASQIANPAAGVASGPPMGLEGEVGTRVMDRYREGFDKPSLQPVIYTLSTEGIEM